MSSANANPVKPSILPPLAVASTDVPGGGEMLLDMLARLGCGYVVLDAGRKIAASNGAALGILARELRAVGDASGSRDDALRELMHRAGARPAPGGMCWIATSAKDGLCRVLRQCAGGAPEGTCLVMVVDLDARPEPKPETLRQVFGLSEAEAYLALELAKGRTPADVAARRRVSRTTVRSQLGAVFAKTNTRRQAELVALLGRVAVLP